MEKGNFSIVNANQFILNLFKMSSMDKVVKIVATEEVIEKYKNDIIQHRFFDAVQQDNSKKQKLNLYKHLNNHDQKLLKILKKDPFASFQIIQHGFNSLKELQPNTKYKLTSDIPSNKTAPSYMS